MSYTSSGNLKASRSTFNFTKRFVGKIFINALTSPVEELQSVYTANANFSIIGLRPSVGAPYVQSTNQYRYGIENVLGLIDPSRTLRKAFVEQILTLMSTAYPNVSYKVFKDGSMFARHNPAEFVTVSLPSPAAGEPNFAPVDSFTIHWTVSGTAGHTVLADIKISSTVGNVVQTRSDAPGVYVNSGLPYMQSIPPNIQDSIQKQQFFWINNATAQSTLWFNNGVFWAQIA